MSSSRTQSQSSTATPMSSFVQCSCFILIIVFVSRHIRFKRNLAQLITLVAEWIDTYGIHHWRIFRSNYRKLTCMGFEPTTTELRSDILTDWAIRSWVTRWLTKEMAKMKPEHWTKDEIGVAVQSWLWVRLELMAW